MKELGITKDPQEYLQEWGKQNNPFYPDEMRWDRVKVNTFLKDWKQQCNTTTSELLERYNEAIEALNWFIDFPEEDLKGWIEEGKPVTITVPSKAFELALQTISKANKVFCQTPDACQSSYYHQIGDYYCSKCEKTGLK